MVHMSPGLEFSTDAARHNGVTFLKQNLENWCMLFVSTNYHQGKSGARVARIWCSAHSTSCARL